MINNINLNNVKTYIIDEFQKEKFSIMILNIVNNNYYDFFKILNVCFLLSIAFEMT